MYTRKTKLFTIAAADLVELTTILDIAPDTRGWKSAVQYVNNFSIGEIRCCEMGGGAKPFLDLLCQRGWTVGKMMDLCAKLGNQSAVDVLENRLEDTADAEVELQIVGERDVIVGESIKLCAHAPARYADVQWYYEKSCLRAEKSRYLVIDRVTSEHSGRYKVRLEAGPKDIKWLMLDVAVLEKGPPNEVEFILQPTDFILQRTGGDAHFFVDVRPLDAQLQWYCNGIVIPDANQQYLIIPQLDQNSHRKQFKCEARAGTKNITSEVALIRWVPHEPKVFDSEALNETATDKVALVIGNQCYREPTFNDILHAEDDARDIALSLKELNFKVVSLINLTLLELHVACENFYKLLSTGVYGVFYFAGHGFEYGGENYLMPVDAPEHVKVEHCMKAQLVLHRMQFRDTKLNLLLLDMCRDQFPNVGLAHDLQPVQSFGNTAIGFACGPGSRAYGSENDKNGIYVKYLKEHITRHVSVTTLLDTVNRAIGTKEPNIDQRPHYQSSLISNISLTDQIDPTNYTVEFHHRAQIWHQANHVDVAEEELGSGHTKLSVTYTAQFSNVLLVTLQCAARIDSVTLDTLSDSEGLVLNMLEPGLVEIRNIQRLVQPQIVLVVRAQGTQLSVVIQRPLFSKIVAGNNLGSVFDVDVYGSTRHDVQAAVPESIAVQGRCIEDHSHQSDEMKENKEKARKQFEERKGEKKSEFHQPLLIEDHSSAMVYPYATVYLLPQINSGQSSSLAEIEKCILSEADRTHRTHQLALVDIQTYIVGQEARPWIEVVLVDKEYCSSNRSVLEGRNWHTSNFKYSPHLISMLNMLESFARQNAKCSELWVTDGPMWQQIVPEDGILAECNPVNIPIA